MISKKGENVEIICSYCHTKIGEKEPSDCHDISHGMCLKCRDYFIQQWGGMKLGEYLDTFSRPIMAVDTSGRIMAVNDALAQMMGADRSEVPGLLGGEFMECQFARLPEGCGNTIHCKECTIRNTVMETMTSGVGLKRVPATLRQDDKRITFLISTEVKKEFIAVTIEEVLDIMYVPKNTMNDKSRAREVHT